MSFKVLYLGDTALNSAASYLAGVLSHHGTEFDFVASNVAFRASALVYWERTDLEEKSNAVHASCRPTHHSRKAPGSGACPA